MTNTEISFADVAWFRADKRFGAAIMRRDKTQFGIHMDNGRMFYCGTNQAQLRLDGRRLTTLPNPGDTICVNRTRTSMKGKLHADIWALASDWETAGNYIVARSKRLKAIENHLPLLMMEEEKVAEEKRLYYDPKFRCVEQEHRFENRQWQPTSKPMRVVVEGTQSEILKRLDSTQRGYRPILVESGKTLDCFQYQRWFERETAHGWTRCEDVRRVNLPARPRKAKWNFEEAWLYLRTKPVRRAPHTAGVAFYWHDNRGNIIAQGNCENVFISPDENHEETEIKDAEAEFLWEQSDLTNYVAEPPRIYTRRPTFYGDWASNP